MYTDDAPSRADFLFDGMPAVLKFHSGETVIATVCEDEEEGTFYLDRPVLCNVVRSQSEPSPDGAHRERVQLKFERWVRESAAIVFPIGTESVMHITLCTEAIVPMYWKNAEALYAHLVEEEQRREESEVLAQMTAEDATEDDMPSPLFLAPDRTRLSDEQIQAHQWSILLAKMPKTMQPN